MASNGVRELHETNAAPQFVAWRAFLRGLAIELDTQVGPDTSQAILRGAGQHMAGLLVVPAVDSLKALELEMNFVLAEIGWGDVQLTLQEDERCVVMIHRGLPHIGSAGEPPGRWLAPVLEGLLQGWMGQQPGADGSFAARIRRHEGDKVLIGYGRL